MYRRHVDFRRDVTLGEDACRTSNRTGAEALACLRNLANGAYELERAKGRITVDTLKAAVPHPALFQLNQPWGGH